MNKATDFGADATFDPDAWGLYAIDAEEWRGLVFLRLKRGGPGLMEWLGPIHDMAADYPLEQQHYFMSKNRDCAVDWKTYGENYLECYHCRTMHPGLCASMDIDNYRIDIYEHEKFFHLHAPRRDGGLTRGLYFYRFPCLMLNLYDWGSSIATIEPLGPGRIEHINWYFFTDVSPEKAEENRQSAEWSAQIVTEDLDIITGVQRNLNAGVYDRGPAVAEIRGGGEGVPGHGARRTRPPRPAAQRRRRVRALRRIGLNAAPSMRPMPQTRRGLASLRHEA